VFCVCVELRSLFFGTKSHVHLAGRFLREAGTWSAEGVALAVRVIIIVESLGRLGSCDTCVKQKEV
jgi:hypothetical protein